MFIFRPTLSPVKITFYLILISAFAMGNTAADTSAAVSTTIKHHAVSSFTPGHRVVLEAVMSDDQGIDLSRCYFRYRQNTGYYYLDMQQSQPGIYRGVLPAADSSVTMLEYFFLVVNTEKQVIRSISYTADKSRTLSIPELSLADTQRMIKVLSESGDVSMDGFKDSNLAIQKPTGPFRRYGWIVGVDEMTAAHGSLPFVRDYFGGFLLDQTGATARAVKGIGVGLLIDPNTGADQSKLEQQGSQLESGYPDVAGDDWSGVFFVTDKKERKPITATITRTGSSITIKTSRSGHGHHFKGTINQDGDVFVYDQHDGESWTSYWGPATSTLFRILDFVRPPTWRDPNPPLYVIAMSRTLTHRMQPAIDLLLDQL